MKQYLKEASISNFTGSFLHVKESLTGICLNKRFRDLLKDGAETTIKKNIIIEAGVKAAKQPQTRH